MILFLRSCVVRFFWGLIPFVGSLLCIPFCLIPSERRYDNRIYYTITWYWNRLILWVSGISYTIQGTENLPIYPHNPAIFVMNHSSALDIPLSEMLAGTYPHIWISKAEYAKIPLFNILLKRMNVLVKRDSPRDAVMAFHRFTQLLQNKVRHGFLFPEGTRYSDGTIHPFISGFARVAKQLNKPVIPILFVGVHKILPKKQFIIDHKAGNVTIVIGKPMYPQPEESIQTFTTRVHTWFTQELAKYT